MIGEDKVRFFPPFPAMPSSRISYSSSIFSGVAAGEACTVVLRGSTIQMVDEAERSLHDALSVLSQKVKETLYLVEDVLKCS